jgi:thymidylate synthase
MQSYCDLVNKVLNDGSFRKEPNKNSDILSYFGYLFEHDMSKGFPLLTSKKMAYKQIFSELDWFIKGRTDLKWLLDNNNDIWLGDAYKKHKDECERVYLLKKGSLTIEQFKEIVKRKEFIFFDGCNLGNIYGSQWRGTYNILAPDQLLELVNNLKDKPFSRKHLVTALNPIENKNMILEPCHFAFQCYVREVDNKKYLDLMWYQRSADVALGVAFNIASYALLLMLIAKDVNMEVGFLKCSFGDVHLYKEHIDTIKDQLNCENFQELPTIDISETSLFNFDYNKVKVNNYKYNNIFKYKLIN